MAEITGKAGQKKTALFVRIPGPPVGKGRPRVTRAGRTYTPKLTREWEEKAVTIMRAHWRREPLEGLVWVLVEAVKARPQAMQGKRWPEGELWRDKKPDADNVLKACADAAEKAGICKNDSQIAQMTCRSLYAAKGQPPEVRVTFGQICGQIYTVED